MQLKPLDTQFTYKEIRYNYALSNALSYITPETLMGATSLSEILTAFQSGKTSQNRHLCLQLNMKEVFPI